MLEVYPGADESQIKKSQFFPDDFESITTNDIAAMGFFWVALVQRMDGLSTPAARAGPSAASSSDYSESDLIPDYDEPSYHARECMWCGSEDCAGPDMCGN